MTTLAADLTTITLARFSQVADAFTRGGHLITQARDDDSGKFGDDGLSDAVSDLATVFGHHQAAGQDIVAFDDPSGHFLAEPGRGVAFRDTDEMGGIAEESDLGESNLFSAADARSTADTFDAAASAARLGGPAGELQRTATLHSAGLDIAAFHDGEGIWGDPGASYVAMGYQGNTVDWDAPDLAGNEGITYTLFDPDEVEDLAAALREAAATPSPVKTGLSRKVDRLALDGRIPLEAGERLTGSSGVDAVDSSDIQPVLAATAGLNGPQLRVGATTWEEAREWDASEGDGTAVLDADGYAQLQAAMQAVPARANLMRADYARDVIAPEQAQVDALTARRDEIRMRTHPTGLTEQQHARLIELEDETDDRIARSEGWVPYVETYRQLTDLRKKYFRQDDDGTMYGSPMTPEDKAEETRLREEVNRLHDRFHSLSVIDNLQNKIHQLRIAGDDDGRDLTPEERAEIDSINDQIRAVYNNPDSPGIDDMLFNGRIPGVKWGDLRYEVHGSDSDWEDNPTGVGTWRMRMSIIPKDAPLDYDGTDDIPPPDEIDVYPGEIDKLMRAFGKVYATAIPAQTASLRAAERRSGRYHLPPPMAGVDTTSIRQLADRAGLPYEFLTGGQQA